MSLCSLVGRDSRICWEGIQHMTLSFLSVKLVYVLDPFHQLFWVFYFYLHVKTHNISTKFGLIELVMKATNLGNKWATCVKRDLIGCLTSHHRSEFHYWISIYVGSNSVNPRVVGVVGIVSLIKNLVLIDTYLNFKIHYITFWTVHWNTEPS